MSLSLLIAYRNRIDHFETLLKWASSFGYSSSSEYEFIFIEQSGKPSISNACNKNGFKYFHVMDTGPFKKSALLNLGLKNSTKDFVTPYDIDMTPIGNTLHRHLDLAMKLDHCLLTGYRVMSRSKKLSAKDLDGLCASQGILAPEDRESALFKHLTTKEKFGVIPIFKRDLLSELGGWDENFVGWGAEDQELIDRYTLHHELVRSPSLVYLHLDHPNDPNWKEKTHTKANRDYYAVKRSGSNQN